MGWLLSELASRCSRPFRALSLFTKHCPSHRKRPVYRLPPVSNLFCVLIHNFSSQLQHLTSSVCASDIIPTPTLSSGSPALQVADHFPSPDYHQMNQESGEQLSRTARQSVDQVIHDLRSSQRIQV